MRMAAAEYASLKAFLAWMWDRIMPTRPGLAPEDQPLAVLERFEARSMAVARRSLAVGLGDMIELTDRLPPDQVREVDAALAEAGLVSLSEVRARFGRAVAAILRRGEVRGEREYYLLRNAADLLAETQQAEAWRLLAAYEDCIAPGKETAHGH
jgi:hypothetical protein